MGILGAIRSFERATRSWNIRRLAGKALRRLFPNFRPRVIIARMSGNDIPVSVFGYTMYVDGKDLCLAPALMEDGVWEPELTSFMLRTLRPGMTMVDIGANIGYFSILAAAKVGEGGRVFAFEPGKRNVELMEKNITANGFRNIIVMRAAVTAVSGKTMLYTSDLDYGDHRSYPVEYERVYTRGVPIGERVRGREVVDTISLDEYFRNIPGNINFIKMDIEGAEYPALQGMKEILRKNKNVVVLTEFWPAGMALAKTDPTEFLREVRSLGLETHLLSPNDVPRPATDTEIFAAVQETKDMSMNIVLRRS